MDGVVALHLAAAGLILGVPKNFSLDVTEIDGAAQNSGQRLDSVNRAHLVLASGELELQKIKEKTKHYKLPSSLLVLTSNYPSLQLQERLKLVFLQTKDGELSGLGRLLPKLLAGKKE